MTLAYAPTGDHTICYRLRQEFGQVKLRLWEPPAQIAPHQEAQPYLYAANFTFNTVAEAESFLRDHLLQNGAFDVPESNFPGEGQIEILPFPTWGIESS